MGSSKQTASPVVYTVKDLVNLLQRSESSIQRDLAVRRIPPGFLLGGRRRWLRTEVDAWIADGCPDLRKVR